MQKKTIIKIATILLSIMILQSCSDIKYIDEDTFLGQWELKGRDMYSEMKISIVKENDKMRGYTISPPNNKYGQLFMEANKIWISNITRGSNYYFKITEQKIANELFSEYNLEPISVFYATFSENKDKIYLTQKRPNKFIQESDIYYKRIK